MQTTNHAVDQPTRPTANLQLLLYAAASTLMPFVAAAVLLLIGQG
jgi:hypothetical protein